MSKVSRREVVLSATTAAALFGLDGPLAFLGSAEAQGAGSGAGSKADAAGKKMAPIAPKAAHLEKGFHKFKVGDVEVIQIFDGTADGPLQASFVPGRTEDEIRSALVKAGHDGKVRPNYFTVTVIRSKGKTIMFDSSTGGQLAPTAGLMMAKNMYKAGVEPHQISTIIVTHFHPDHIFGMMSKETNSQVFSHAEIIVPAAEYKYWTAAETLEKMPEARKGLVRRIQATFPKWKNIRQIEDGAEVIPGVRAVATYGHTPGHTSYLVTSGKRQMMVLGDLTNIPAINVVNPDWSIMFDQDKAMAAAARRKVFDRAIADKITMTGYHWGMPGAGTVRKDGNGYVFVPVKA
jgi:glyoxylase-like metal-dependent hydrolase (beta-lactamase superfamily II)